MNVLRISSLAAAKLSLHSKAVDLSAAFPTGNKVESHPVVYRLPRQPGEDSDRCVALRQVLDDRRIRLFMAGNRVDLMPYSLRLKMARSLSRITGAKLRPTQDGTPSDYEVFPRSAEEVHAMRRMLSDVVWFYDQFRPEEDYQLGGSPFGPDDWDYLVCKARVIREKYSLPDQRTYTDLEWAGIKNKLAGINWMLGFAWDHTAG